MKTLAAIEDSMRKRLQDRWGISLPRPMNAGTPAVKDTQ